MGEKNVYPYDESFQTKAVALMVREPSFMMEYRDLFEPEYFSSGVHSALVRIIVDHFDETGSVPSGEIMKMLAVDYLSNMKIDSDFREKAMNLLSALYKVDLSNQKIITDRISWFGQTKVIEDMLEKAASLTDKGNDPNDIWELIDHARNKSSAGGIGTDLGSKLLDAQEICGNDGLYNNAMKVGTSYPTLDEAFNGGLGRKELGVVVGYTGIGKSAFLVNLGAAALEQRLPVIHISIGELEQVDLLARYASRISGFPLAEIVSGRAGSDYKKKMATWIAQYQPRIASRYFNPYTPCSTIRSFLSRCRYQMKQDPALLVIDNADDLSSARRTNDSYDELGHVYIQLKSIAHDFNVAIWADSQTNRSAIRQEVVDLDSMADSFKKARKADVVLTVSQNQKEFETSHMRLKIAKARRYNKTSNPIVHCKVEHDKMLVREVPADDPELFSA